METTIYDTMALEKELDRARFIWEVEKILLLIMKLDLIEFYPILEGYIDSIESLEDHEPVGTEGGYSYTESKIYATMGYLEKLIDAKTPDYF